MKRLDINCVPHYSGHGSKVKVTVVNPKTDWRIYLLLVVIITVHVEAEQCAGTSQL